MINRVASITILASIRIKNCLIVHYKLSKFKKKNLFGVHEQGGVHESRNE